MMPRPALVFFTCFFISRAYSQSSEIFKPDSARNELIAAKIHSALHIDGVLNEPEWQLVNSSPGFTEIEPYQGTAPKFQTVVKVLYNRQN